VQAVSTFYSMYFKRPAGRHHMLVCVNVACALRGADDIAQHLEHALCPSGHTTADGEFTWESTIECLGACGGAPAMQVDHHTHENLTVGSVDALLAQLRATPSEHAATGPGGAAVERPAGGPHPAAGATPPSPASAGPPGVSSSPAGRDTPEASEEPTASPLFPVPTPLGDADGVQPHTADDVARSTGGTGGNPAPPDPRASDHAATPEESTGEPG
jgi:hypothetical protein